MTDNDHRGSLEVRSRAVVRMAEISAGRVDGVEPVTGGLTGRSLPRVEANVSSGRIRATVEAATRWPTPIADVATRIRLAVATDLAQHSGLDVDKVDVRVHYVAPEAHTKNLRRVE